MQILKKFLPLSLAIVFCLSLVSFQFSTAEVQAKELTAKEKLSSVEKKYGLKQVPVTAKNGSIKFKSVEEFEAYIKEIKVTQDAKSVTSSNNSNIITPMANCSVRGFTDTIFSNGTGWINLYSNANYCIYYGVATISSVSSYTQLEGLHVGWYWHQSMLSNRVINDNLVYVDVAGTVAISAVIVDAGPVEYDFPVNYTQTITIS
jgi:hypothetical protein